MKSLESVVLTSAILPFHLGKIREIDASDFGGVRWKTKETLAKQGIRVDEEYIDEGILALKQYYAITILDPLNMHAVSDLVDPFWHAHILHTEEYIDFCNRTVGGYMHHSPLDHGRAKHVQGVDRLYRYTSKCFRKFFTYVNPTFFPLHLKDENLLCAHFGTEEYGKDLQLNALLPRNSAMQREVALPA